jgi:aryl-alcohol dehydrogenase-like predicted oxidoreductase
LDLRTFGASGPLASAIGVGCSRLGGVFSSASSYRDELKLVNGAIDAGINFFDTSDLYSQGQSEVLLGKAVRSRRSEVILATKGGYVRSRESRLLARAKPIARPLIRALRVKRPHAAGGTAVGPIMQDFTPDYLAEAVEGSLRRLRTDYIDIYQLHSPPADVIEAGRYVEVLDRLRTEGKILRFGIAADQAADVAAFDRHPSISSLQVPFSIVDQSAGRLVFPKASGSAVGVIARSCFAAGLLVSSLSEDELRGRTPEWRTILAFRSKAEMFGRTPREAALQFNLAADAIAVTILGMSTPQHLRQILDAYEAPALSTQERAAFVDLDRV